MATKVDTFVTSAEAELSQIRRRMEEIALDAQRLSNRWNVLGRQNMTGWAEYNWTDKPYTALEFQTALNGLTQVVDTADAVNLTNAHTAMKAIDKIVKASL